MKDKQTTMMMFSQDIIMCLTTTQMIDSKWTRSFWEDKWVRISTPSSEKFEHNILEPYASMEKSYTFQALIPWVYSCFMGTKRLL